jgi:hypothetical protein
MNLKPLFIMSFLIVATLSYFNCRGGNKEANDTASTDQNTEEGVTVSAQVEDDDSVEFVQAGESVQIGGTNLTQTTRKLTIYSVDVENAGVKEEVLHTEDLTGNTFEVKNLPLNKFMRITIDSDKGAIIQPIISDSGAKTATIKLSIDGEMTIALKLFDLILKQVKDADLVASKIVQEKTLNIIDLLSTGGAIWEAQKDLTESSSSKIELSTIAADLVDSTKKLLDFLPEISPKDFAQIISQANQNTILSNTKTGNPNSSILSQIGVLTLQKKLEDQSGGKQTSSLNPGFTTVKKLAADNSDVLAAYVATQDLAAKQVTTYAETGEISSGTEEAITAKKLENIQIFNDNPESVNSIQPKVLTSEEYSQFVSATIENQNTTSSATTDPVATPTSTTTSSPTSTTTPTPTTSSTSTTTPTESPTPPPTEDPPSGFQSGI